MSRIRPARSRSALRGRCRRRAESEAAWAAGPPFALSRRPPLLLHSAGAGAGGPPELVRMARLGLRPLPLPVIPELIGGDVPASAGVRP